MEPDRSLTFKTSPVSWMQNLVTLPEIQESAFDTANGIKRLFGHSEAGKSTSKELLRQ